jgi:hypothetical protein
LRKREAGKSRKITKKINVVFMIDTEGWEVKPRSVPDSKGHFFFREALLQGSSPEAGLSERFCFGGQEGRRPALR